MAVRMRAALALSSCRLSDPSSRPSPRPSRLKCAGSGISWSRPPTADATAECVAAQSDMTQPAKPSVPLRSATRVCSSAHAAVPLTLLYAHMTEPTPARTAASNGGMYTSHRVRSVASSLTGAPILNGPKLGEPRSCSCELRMKCLALAMIPADWMPVITGPASFAPSAPSSPDMYSKLRPSCGRRATLSPGPSCTFAPLARNSAPIAVPHRLAATGSQVAAMERPLGQQVEVPGCAGSRKPCGPSLRLSGGMPSRLIPRTWPV